jgi:RNA polymerase sigma-70 factor (ECF subfamily)
MPPEQDTTVEILMRQALAGDKRAYESVLHYTSRLLRPYLLRRLNSASATDDVMQEILLSIHKARHTYDGNRAYAPWAFAIARFRLTDYLRTHYADKLRHAADLSDVEYMIGDDVTKSEFTYESIKGEIDQLPKKQAVILQMIHEEGYTAKEVAEKIGMNESAVKVAAHRAYKVLKKRLDS